MLGCRVATLDPEVANARGGRQENTGGAGRPLELQDPEPWRQPVTVVEVLHEVAAAIRRHVTLSEHAASGVALWVIWTHLIDGLDIAPDF